MAITKPPTVIVPDVGPGPVLPLPDGRVVRLRPVRSADGARRVRLGRAPSPEAVPLLFLTVDPDLDETLVDRLLQVGGHDRSAEIATIGDRLVGVGCVERPSRPDRAEVTVLVVEELRGMGLERALYGALAARAHHDGVTKVVPASVGP